MLEYLQIYLPVLFSLTTILTLLLFQWILSGWASGFHQATDQKNPFLIPRLT